MIYKLIESYMLKLQTTDIEKFSKENGVFLLPEEIDILYSVIKNKWYTIIYEDPMPIFQELRTKLQPQTYKKAEELFFYFKHKYQKFL